MCYTTLQWCINFNFLFTISIVYLLACVSVCTHVRVQGQTTTDNCQHSGLSFHYGGPRDQTQLSRVAESALSSEPLSQLVRLLNQNLSWKVLLKNQTHKRNLF